MLSAQFEQNMWTQEVRYNYEKVINILFIFSIDNFRNILAAQFAPESQST